MREDAIVNEVREFRDKRAAKFGYDLRAIAEDARKREQQSGRKVVSFAHPERHSLERKGFGSG
ncbi:MAG: hypothetical protein KKE86_01150 [Planctomycetes bacterium]|nr:hypothetical protein [Planctomycetota bacterium]